LIPRQQERPRQGRSHHNIANATALLILLTILAGFPAGGHAEPSGTWVLTNPTGRTYSNELVRLKVAVPDRFNATTWTVTEDGQEVPFQTERIGMTTCVWVAADLTGTQKRNYALQAGAPSKRQPRVTVRQEENSIVLDNGLTAVRVPSSAGAPGSPSATGDGLPSPISQIRLPNSQWVGKGFWRTDRKLKSFRSGVVGDGTLFGKVRLEYGFEGVAGIEEVPAFYRADILLPPDRLHVVIEEAFEMSRGSYWEFDAAAGWTPRHAVTIPHFGGFGREEINDPEGKPYPFPPESLRFGQTRMGDTLLNLIPRWSQAYDDGWFFMAHDRENAVGALPCRAGKWLWPHDSMIEVKVRERADYAGFRCPTWRGKRYWHLLAGPANTWTNRAACEEYAVRHSVETLDKIHQEYILDWPGLVPPIGKDGTPVATPEEYCSGASRFGRRRKPFFGWGPGAGSIAANEHPIASLIRAQVYLDPDTFGDYWLFFSPENPNFASSWINGVYDSLRQAAAHPGVSNHPSFKVLCRLAAMKAREEVYHSVTLPSGAGQECFGYMSRGAWSHRSKVCRELGFDPKTEPWQEAAARFIFRTSHPMADGGRRAHPGGDTHPPGPNVFEGLQWFGLKEDLTSLKTEELAGFGVVFRNRPGTQEETYLAFKSGPNRGHFHGDPLSFHYCAYGRPVAVDHHCSYAPRAGQEHMHNRVAFHTDKLPWANMDGYERLIAFRTAPGADVAIGQVESERLRITEKFPPEKWDTSLPEQVFDTPLRYRRTIVMLKGPPDARQATPDIFLIRDQYAGPDLYATYCLHVLGERCERKDNTFDFDGMQVSVVKPSEFAVSRHDWEHENGGREATRGLRLTTKGHKAEFITVVMPRPVKRTDVATLVLKNVLREGISRAKGSKPEMTDIDLSVRLALRDGKPVTPALYVTGVDRLRDVYSFTGTVETGSHNTMRLTVDGVRGRFEKERVRFEGLLQLEWNGTACSGSYTGLVWDVAAMKLLQKGTNAPGREQAGTLAGTLDKDVLPPMSLFDDAWKPPTVAACPGGAVVGDTEVVFDGDIGDDDSVAYVTVRRGRETLVTVTGKDVDMDRSQGEIGLFVPDAGYPFGVIPDWLIRQRYQKPEWYRDLWPPTQQ
jgi:hypothetical protein